MDIFSESLGLSGEMAEGGPIALSVRRACLFSGEMNSESSSVIIEHTNVSAPAQLTCDRVVTAGKRLRAPRSFTHEAVSSCLLEREKKDVSTPILQPRRDDELKRINIKQVTSQALERR